jgi:hypothetical protein
MLRIANQIRKKKALENKWFLYNIIDMNPGLSQYDLNKKIGWSLGKINYYVRKLLKEEMIKCSTEIVNGRTRKSFYGKCIKEFINWDEIFVIARNKAKELLFEPEFLTPEIQKEIDEWDSIDDSDVSED